MDQKTRFKISQTLKLKGIKPPSNKGKKFSKEHITKIIDAKRKNGSLYHTPERTRRIQEARRLFFDRVGRRSLLADRIKNTSKYKHWRATVFKRDNYTCVFCNKRGGRLQADHIVQKAIYFKLCLNDYDKCMKYAPLWDTENGRTLCHKCHKTTETYAKIV